MIALSVAVVGVFGAVILFVVEQRSARREKLRGQFSDALADVYRWAELPYRVRRRRQTETTRFDLAEQISDLQERIHHRSAWLLVESTDVHKAFVELVETTRRRVAPEMEKAWLAPTLQQDKDMSVGNLGIDIADCATCYASAVAAHLRWYVFALWR